MHATQAGGPESPRAKALAALAVKRDPGGLTEEIVRRALLVPVPRRYMLTDSMGKGHVAGLFLRVGAARPGPRGKPIPGKAMFYVQGRVDGRTRFVTIGEAGVFDLAQAREHAREKRIAFQRGVDLNEEKRKAKVEAARRAVQEKSRVSVRTYVEGDYWKKRLKNARGGVEDKARLLDVWKEVLDARLDELTEDAINGVLQTRRDAKKAAGTLLRDWGVFRAMLGQAKEDGLLPALPFNGRRPPALREGKRTLEGKKRIRWLSEAELARFKAVLAEESAEVQAILRLLALTGMRRGEVIGVVRGKGKEKVEVPGLKKSEVSLRERIATIPAERSKNGKERHVRLNAEAVAILKAITVHDLRGCYFPGSVWGWRQRLKKAMERLRGAGKLEDFKLHDLRHVFAVQLRRAGEPLEVVREALGHSNTRTTEIYAHVLPDEVQAAVEKVKL